MTQLINLDSTITLHFELALDNGDVVDSTFEKSPATFSYGDGSLLPSFEKRLLGLMKGSNETFQIPQEEGFGAHNPQNVQTFKKKDFADDTDFSEGMMFTFADAAGGELPGVLQKVEGESVYIDFNHPLAGKTLSFKVEIIDVK